jgi:hypothetical protein
MSQQKWSQPVVLNSPFYGALRVADPFHAIALLMDGWPTMSGPHFTRARIACSAALQGRVALEAAREAFQLAVDEAQMRLQAKQSGLVQRSTSASMSADVTASQ